MFYLKSLRKNSIILVILLNCGDILLLKGLVEYWGLFMTNANHYFQSPQSELSQKILAMSVRLSVVSKNGKKSVIGNPHKCL